MEVMQFTSPSRLRSARHWLFRSRGEASYPRLGLDKNEGDVKGKGCFTV